MKNKIRWDNLAIVLMLSGVGIGIIASWETRCHQIHGVDPGYWPQKKVIDQAIDERGI